MPAVCSKCNTDNSCSQVRTSNLKLFIRVSKTFLETRKRRRLCWALRNSSILNISRPSAHWSIEYSHKKWIDDDASCSSFRWPFSRCIWGWFSPPKEFHEGNNLVLWSKIGVLLNKFVTFYFKVLGRNRRGILLFKYFGIRHSGDWPTSLA